MSLVRWNNSIKRFAINKIGNYAENKVPLKPLLNQLYIVNEDKLYDLNTHDLKLIAKLVFAIMMNIDDRNVGNKGLLEAYLANLRQENIQVCNCVVVYSIDYRLESIINYISKNMKHDPDANFVSPPEKLINVHVGLSIAKITRAAHLRIKMPFTSDETSQHRFNIACDAIMAIFSPMSKLRDSLQRLRQQDLNYEMKKNGFFRLRDSFSLRGTMRQISQFHDLLYNSLNQRIPLPLINIFIEYIQGELPPLIEDRYSRPRIS